jgi:hypothetical protein
MAKQTGLGDNFYLDGYDLSGDIGAMRTVRGGISTFDVTGLDKLAHERLGGKRDGEMGWTGFFNTAAGQLHPVVDTLLRTDRTGMYCRGTALGNPSANLVAKQLNYDHTRTDAGELTNQVDLSGTGYGLEWGTLHTAGKRTDTTATNGTGVDGLAATAFGLQVYLHVFSFAGTSVTVKLQESSDNGVGDAFADVTGGGFTAVTSAPTTQRIQTGRTLAVERYLRVVTTGTFTSAIFAVSVVRNQVSVSF